MIVSDEPSHAKRGTARVGQRHAWAAVLLACALGEAQAFAQDSLIGSQSVSGLVQGLPSPVAITEECSGRLDFARQRGIQGGVGLARRLWEFGFAPTCSAFESFLDSVPWLLGVTDEPGLERCYAIGRVEGVLAFLRAPDGPCPLECSAASLRGPANELGQEFCGLPVIIGNSPPVEPQCQPSTDACQAAFDAFVAARCPDRVADAAAADELARLRGVCERLSAAFLTP